MDPAVIGAFLSGVGAVASSVVVLRRVRKQDEEDCERRIEEVKAAMREGFRLRGDE